MDIHKLGRWAYAAIPGGIGLTIGVTWAVMDELEYKGVTANPIPDLVSLISTAVGAVLLMIAFTSIRKIQISRGGSSGTPGYWIAMAGLLLSAVWIWPLFVLGPLLVGIGTLAYGVSSLAAGALRSFGSWLHVLSIPVGVIVGFAAYAAGYDGGIGIVTFMAMLIVGFMTLGFDAAARDEGPVRREVSA